MLAKQEPDNTGTYTSMQSLRAAKRITEIWIQTELISVWGIYMTVSALEYHGMERHM